MPGGPVNRTPFIGRAPYLRQLLRTIELYFYELSSAINHVLESAEVLERLLFAPSLRFELGDDIVVDSRWIMVPDRLFRKDANNPVAI